MEKRGKLLLGIAAIMGFTAVAIGAFGSHALSTLLEENERTDTFLIASRYHFYHTFAIFGCGLLNQYKPVKQLLLAGYAFATGIIVFSGSLYILAITNIGWLGAVTPFGGVGFLVGWVLLFITARR